ncbi:MAG: hypothetical protein BRD45_02490 [Bacteroidetes bacterium QS_8_64_10]|nr:MAG: hypothetical protein BRD45_02490 [Bacteroidetes bacterium QS_8_64_10]
MTSSVSPQFRKLFGELPYETQDRARVKFALWQENPQHPSLRFKKVSSKEPLWSARISRSYRVLGLREGDHIEWFWIGLHDEYERIIAQF